MNLNCHSERSEESQSQMLRYAQHDTQWINLFISFAKVLAIMPEFYSDEIDVTKDEETKNLISFIWKGREHRIKEVIAFWPDFSYPKSGAKRKRWWQRKHRNYYRVLTEEEEVFEIYLDRGSKKEAWILYTRLE